MNERHETASVVRTRWGEAVTSGETGFTAVPDILIRSQDRLRLSSTELAVLLNLLLHWWRVDEWPYPNTLAVSNRMGASRRTVERTLRSLEEKGLVRRFRSEVRGGGPTVTRFDLSGLVETLRELVEERS